MDDADRGQDHYENHNDILSLLYIELEVDDVL